MSLKLRCPHCEKMLVIDPDVVGQARLCPACGEQFEVPAELGIEPESEPVVRLDVDGSPPMPPAPPARVCPSCGVEVGMTASHCHECQSDLLTGQRPPLGQRLRMMSWRARLVACLVVLAVASASYLGVELYLIRSQPAGPRYEPVTPAPVAANELAQALLTADGLEARRAALARLAGVERRAAPAVGEALAASLERGGDDPVALGNRRAAIDLLARNGAGCPESVTEWIALLRRCERVEGLRGAALRGRGLLADKEVVDELVGLWVEKLKRWLALKRVARVAKLEEQAGAGLLIGALEAEVARCGDGLRGLAEQQPTLVFGRVAELYWESWNWLGQGAGDEFADAVFELGRPRAGRLEFNPQDVRRPRDILKGVALSGPLTARAAAGLILKRRGPQYRTLCQRIGSELVELLPTASPAQQQRMTWSAARLQGKLYGGVSTASPLDVTRVEVAAALEWAQLDLASATGPYPTPPRLSYRTVTTERLLEEDLLADLRAGWETADAALRQWRRFGLGCTPRVRELLDPGQRQPNHAALAAAFVITAEAGDQSVRPQLELWREAADQPGWVRGLAYMALGALDSRQGRWDSGWPANLDVGDPQQLDSGRPGWEYFGRILAAGGLAARERLSEFEPAPLMPAVRDRLLEVARRVAEADGE